MRITITTKSNKTVTLHSDEDIIDIKINHHAVDLTETLSEESVKQEPSPEENVPEKTDSSVPFPSGTRNRVPEKPTPPKPPPFTIGFSKNSDKSSYRSYEAYNINYSQGNTNTYATFDIKIPTQKELIKSPPLLGEPIYPNKLLSLDEMSSIREATPNKMEESKGVSNGVSQNVMKKINSFLSLRGFTKDLVKDLEVISMKTDDIGNDDYKFIFNSSGRQYSLSVLHNKELDRITGKVVEVTDNINRMFKVAYKHLSNHGYPENEVSDLTFMTKLKGGSYTTYMFSFTSAGTHYTVEMRQKQQLKHEMLPVNYLRSDKENVQVRIVPGTMPVKIPDSPKATSRVYRSDRVPALELPPRPKAPIPLHAKTKLDTIPEEKDVKSKESHRVSIGDDESKDFDWEDILNDHIKETVETLQNERALKKTVSKITKNFVGI